MADHKHDIAVSFSGAQRDYVERVVRACEAAGLRVFYDKNATIALWGRNVITELRKIYGGTDTRYVVPFLSREYLAGAYPMDEFRYATLSALYREEYLLPVVMDDVEIPPEHLNPAMGYLKATNLEPEQLADLIVQRVGSQK